VGDADQVRVSYWWPCYDECCRISARSAHLLRLDMCAKSAIFRRKVFS
jgi:hypothetical protein